MKQKKRTSVWILYLIAASLSGCAQRPLVERLESREPLERVQAIQQIAQTDRTDLLPQLVDRLDDDDVAVRMYAILALERLEGDRLGYDYAAPPAARREAVQRWRQRVQKLATNRVDKPTGQASPTTSD